MSKPVRSAETTEYRSLDEFRARFYPKGEPELPTLLNPRTPIPRAGVPNGADLARELLERMESSVHSRD